MRTRKLRTRKTNSWIDIIIIIDIIIPVHIEAFNPYSLIQVYFL